MKLFLQKNAKFLSADGSTPRPPCLRQLGALSSNPQPTTARGSTPTRPKQLPPLRISGYAPAHSQVQSTLRLKF